MNQGISVLHPWHHVAQKFRTTTLPLKSESFTGLPDASFNVKSGAILRSASGFTSVLTTTAPDAVVRLCQTATEQSRQRCAKARGAGRATKHTYTAATDAIVTAAIQLQLLPRLLPRLSRSRASPRATFGCHSLSGLRIARCSSTQ